MKNWLMLVISSYWFISGNAVAQSFKTDVNPLIKSACIDCHDEDTETGLNLEAIGHDLSDADTFRRWEKTVRHDAQQHGDRNRFVRSKHLSFLKTPSDRFAAQFGHRHKRCHPVDELTTVTERAPALRKSLELAVTRGLVAADHSGRPM